MSLVENLKYKIQDFQIDIPRWEILDHGVTVLWGPSGSGKTTIFRLLLGLEHCTGWSWTFNNQDLSKMPSPQRKLGVVFQTLDLFPHMTAKENILFAARARKLEEKKQNERLQHLVDSLRMKSFLDRPARVLSGGERQRVAIARAIVGEPKLLLLDEPFSALDIDLRQESQKLIKQVLEQEKIPTLLVTHDLSDVQALADKVTKIQAGKIIEEN